MSPTIRRTSRFRTSPFIYEWAKFSVGCRNQIGQQLVQLAPNWTQAFGLQEIRMNKLVRLLAVPGSVNEVETNFQTVASFCGTRRNHRLVSVVQDSPR
jgi:hypothetical protein